MQNATVDRLSKIIAKERPHPEDNGGRNRRVQQQLSNIFAHLRLAEGWFSFVLLALVVYSTIWSVQAVGWVDHSDLLTPLTALGLLCGVIAAKQQRLPRVLVHILAVVLSLLFAFWQTSNADWGSKPLAFFNSMRAWLTLALSGGTNADDSIFLFFILALGFLLAYTSAWLIYRTRSPWLVLLANAVVLLLNLSYINAGYIIFLIVFLVAALLLLLRFNLYESSVRWKRQGLRCSDELSWEYMQAGSLIALAILVCSWLLPWGYTNQQAAEIWSAENNPWVQAQNLWNRVFSVSGGNIPQNHGNFTSLLTLGGNPNLTNTLVFHVKTNDGTQYLMYSSYDQYDAVRSWSNGPQSVTANPANIVFYDGSSALREVDQTVRVVNPPGEQYAYIFGASQVAAANQVAQRVWNKSDGEVIAWLRNNGKLVAGDSYTVVSYVSDADEQTLRSVPMPSAAPVLPPNYEGQAPLTYYAPAVLSTYTSLPKSLDTRIKALAFQITAHASTMYDKVAALENYLRGNYTYDAAISAPPPGQEAASWFLFHTKRGFCNYFATAMTLMARELGIPARVAAGYTNGKYNAQTNQWDIMGTDAHAWTQIYFAGYGWVNFEPSATFSQFARPVKPTGGSTTTVSPPGSISPASKHPGGSLPQDASPTGALPAASGESATASQIRQDVGIVVLVLIALIVGGLVYFTFWWRRLFRGLSLPAQAYGRVSILAGWAGIAGKRSQTPREYMLSLAAADPEDAVTFERLGDIYARTRWATRDSPDHPDKTGESAQVPALWKSVQPHLVLYALRHPHFLRQALRALGRWLRRPFTLKNRTTTPTVIVEEHIE